VNQPNVMPPTDDAGVSKAGSAAMKVRAEHRPWKPGRGPCRIARANNRRRAS
jgi:hypothetical protein